MNTKEKLEYINKVVSSSKCSSIRGDGPEWLLSGIGEIDKTELLKKVPEDDHEIYKNAPDFIEVMVGNSKWGIMKLLSFHHYNNSEYPQLGYSAIYGKGTNVTFRLNIETGIIDKLNHYFNEDTTVTWEKSSNEKAINQAYEIAVKYDEDYELTVETSKDSEAKEMEVIYAQEKLKFSGDSIFLAGPTPRSEDVKSWRPDFIEKLKESGFKGKVLLPEMRNPNDWKKENGFAYAKQIEWEEQAMEKASTIIFWIPREMQTMPALTTNIEFGYWFAKEPSKLIVGVPVDAEKCDYIRYKAEQKCLFYETVEEVVTKISEIY